MSIVVLKGAAKACEKLANEMRNQAITARRGALIVRANKVDLDGNPESAHDLLEKIVNGMELHADPKRNRPIAEIPWKADPTIICINDGQARLAEFERVVPGFIKKFGPPKNVPVE